MASHDTAARQLNPDQALARGRWVKLICGASNQDLPAITDLCAVFGAAGVHCVDVAADPAVVRAAREGLAWASERGFQRPWLMVSLSDGADAHFRKAWFDPRRCPLDCPRPCQRVCPAEAIPSTGMVDADRCYGCGRCRPACPLGLIEEREHRVDLLAMPDLLAELCPDAVEIHTAQDRSEAFEAVVSALAASSVPLRRLAVGCGLEGMGSTPPTGRELWKRRQPARRRFSLSARWRPMVVMWDVARRMQPFDSGG